MDNLVDFFAAVNNWSLRNPKTNWIGFISFCGPDRNSVLHLAEKLDVDVFVDSKDIRVGTSLDSYIQSSLDGALCLIVFLSKQLIQYGGYALEEIDLYFQKNLTRKFVVVCYGISKAQLPSILPVGSRLENLYHKYLRTGLHLEWVSTEPSQQQPLLDSLRQFLLQDQLTDLSVPFPVGLEAIGLIPLDLTTREFASLFAQYASQNYRSKVQVRIVENLNRVLSIDHIMAGADTVLFLLPSSWDLVEDSAMALTVLRTMRNTKHLRKNVFAISAICLAEVDALARQAPDPEWKWLTDQFCFQTTPAEKAISASRGELNFIERIIQSLLQGQQLPDLTAKSFSFDQIAQTSLHDPFYQTINTGISYDQVLKGVPISYVEPLSSDLPFLVRPMKNHRRESSPMRGPKSMETFIHNGQILKDYLGRVRCLLSISNNSYLLGTDAPRNALLLVDHKTLAIRAQQQLDAPPVSLTWNEMDSLVAVGTLAGEVLLLTSADLAIQKKLSLSGVKVRN